MKGEEGERGGGGREGVRREECKRKGVVGIAISTYVEEDNIEGSAREIFDWSKPRVCKQPHFFKCIQDTLGIAVYICKSP